MDLDLLPPPHGQLHEEGMAKTHHRRQWGRYLGTPDHEHPGSKQTWDDNMLFIFFHPWFLLAQYGFCLLAPPGFGTWTFTTCGKELSQSAYKNVLAHKNIQPLLAVTQQSDTP